MKGRLQKLTQVDTGLVKSRYGATSRRKSGVVSFLGLGDRRAGGIRSSLVDFPQKLREHVSGYDFPHRDGRPGALRKGHRHQGFLYGACTSDSRTRGTKFCLAIIRKTTAPPSGLEPALDGPRSRRPRRHLLSNERSPTYPVSPPRRRRSKSSGKGHIRQANPDIFFLHWVHPCPRTDAVNSRLTRQHPFPSKLTARHYRGALRQEARDR